MIRNFSIPIRPNGVIYGDLEMPAIKKPIALCIFVHGSGSSRFSSRNQYVAHLLQSHGFATLLIDLLTPEEAQEDEITGRFRFDIPLLTQRVVDAIDFSCNAPEIKNLKIATFGASTGAAGKIFTKGIAALWAAGYRPNVVKCVVSRGGRPDLVPNQSLSKIMVPTCFIIGGNDFDVIKLNQKAHDHLASTVKEFNLVPNATHLFEETGTLGMAAEIAADFLVKQFGKEE